MRANNNTYKYLAVGVLALFLWLISTQIVHLPFIIDSEKLIITSLSKSKKTLSDIGLSHGSYDKDFFEKKFLIINTSFDYQLAKDANYPGTFFGADSMAPTIPVTDRRKLVKLLTWLADHKDQYNTIICDLLFEDSLHEDKTTDSNLSNCIDRLQISPSKILFAGFFNEEDGAYAPGIFKNIRDNNKAAVNKNEVDELFFKYKLSYNKGQILSLPLKMYQHIDSVSIEEGYLRFKKQRDREEKLSLFNNTFIPDMLFNYEYFSQLKSFATTEGNIDSTVAMINLGEVAADTGVLKELLYMKSGKKKSVFIGNFSVGSGDSHKTIYGDEKGSIIILNIYYDLVHGQHLFRIWHSLFLFGAFLLMCYWMLFHPHQENVKIEGPMSYIWRQIVENRHYVVLILTTMIFYFFFHQVLNIIVFSLFFLVTEIVLRHARKYKIVKKSS